MAFLHIFHSACEGLPQSGQFEMGLSGLDFFPSQVFFEIIFPSPVAISAMVKTCKYIRHLLRVLCS